MPVPGFNSRDMPFYLALAQTGLEMKSAQAAPRRELRFERQAVDPLRAGVGRHLAERPDAARLAPVSDLDGLAGVVPGRRAEAQAGREHRVRDRLRAVERARDLERDGLELLVAAGADERGGDAAEGGQVPGRLLEDAPPPEQARTLAETRDDFVSQWVAMGSAWGINRTMAQIHALLYLSPEPLNAEVICDTLGVARSNVSNSLRELQNWGIV